MQILLAFSFLFVLADGYMDFSVVKIDRRLYNDEGYINPYKFIRRSVMVLNNLPPKVSNAVAWNRFSQFLQKVYGPENATRIENLANTVSDTISMLPEIAQSLAVGMTIDGWNALFPRSGRGPSTATVQGITAWQMFLMSIQQAIYPELGSLFYNPFDTEMLAALNSSDVLALKLNLFKYFNLPYDYRNDYIANGPESYKYAMNSIHSK